MNVVSLENVSKTYHNHKDLIFVLKQINLKVIKSQSISIIGPSGSGKSTLLSLLSGLDNPSSGSIEIAGLSLEKMSVHELAKLRADHIGIIFQQFHLLSHLTALDNVALARMVHNDPEAYSKARSALEKVSLSHRAKHLPSQLSGGESQRVAIARALVGKPKLILADEPTGNLDVKTGEEVADLLFDLIETESTSLVLVTHNLELAKRCKKIFKLIDGTLHEYQ